MKTKYMYSSKAEKYAKYRWDYAPAVIDAIMTTTGISHHSIIPGM